MQRKRRNINFGNFSKSPGKYQKKFNNSITNTTLHGIPTVRMSESNKKSLATPSETFCGKIVNSANVTWWASRNRALRAVISTRPSQTFMVPFGGIERSSENLNRAYSTKIVMTPLSRLARYLSFSRNLKFPLYITCTLLLSFVVSSVMNGFECYAAVNPTTSLSVSNPTLSTTVAPGDTAYLSSNVTYSASDIDSYTLQVSYANGYNSLKLDGGTTTLSGANGTSGSSLANNSWGFAWTNDTTTNNTSTNSGLTYYTVPTYGTNGSGLSTGRLESASNLTSAGNTTLSSTTKRIVFAAKFAENNTNSGHYKTGVQLSMVATPRKLTLADISKMQDMYGNYSICTNTPLISGQKYSAEYTLTDTRDGKAYTVRKFGDGKCWMTQNLLLKGSRTLTASDSDVKSNYTLPAPITSLTSTDFSNSDYYKAQSYNANTANSGNTMYYSWTAATAGAGASSTLTSDSVDTSICPKGWKLPSGGDGEFLRFAHAESITNSAAGSTKIQGLPYNFKHTGSVRDGSLKYSTNSGNWWSSTAHSASNTYILYIASDIVYTTAYDDRCLGLAVRCIARDS